MKISINIKNTISLTIVGIIFAGLFSFIQIQFYNRFVRPKMGLEIQKQIVIERQNRDFQLYEIFNQNKNKKIKC